MSEILCPNGHRRDTRDGSYIAGEPCLECAEAHDNDCPHLAALVAVEEERDALKAALRRVVEANDDPRMWNTPTPQSALGEAIDDARELLGHYGGRD